MTNPISGYQPQCAPTQRSTLNNIQLKNPTTSPGERSFHKLKLTDPTKVSQAAQQALSNLQTDVEHTQQARPVCCVKTPPQTLPKPSKEAVEKAKKQHEKGLESTPQQTPLSSPGSDTSKTGGCLVGSGNPNCQCALCEFNRWFD